MKKLNRKGFTLIELLAVITIMGILMMVAIPSVSRTIENSRRDTFASTAKTYLNAVREAALANNLKCGSKEYAEMPDGTYYYVIDSASDLDLLEAGGKSSWGNSNVEGVVVWTKSNNRTTYGVAMCDSGKHGIKLQGAVDAGHPTIKVSDSVLPKVYLEDQLKRGVVITSGCEITKDNAAAIATDNRTSTAKTATACTLG